MGDFKAELQASIARSHDEVYALARRTVDAGGLTTISSDDELEQLVRATEAILAEALDGGSETRSFVLETAVPAYVEAGETAASIAATSTSFAIELSALLVAQMPEDTRAEALQWLAAFYGGYVRDTLNAVERARS